MRIGINLRDLDFERTKSLGIMNVSRGLLHGLAECEGVKELHVLSNASLGRPFEEAKPKLIYHFHDMEPPRGFGRVLWDQCQVAHAVRRLNLDWLILPKGGAPLLCWPTCKVCCYVHDRIFEYYQGRDDNPFSRRERHYYAACLRKALKKANLVVTNSRFTCDCLQDEREPLPCYPVGIGFDFPQQDRQCGPQGRTGILLLTSKLPHRNTAKAIDWLLRWEDETGSQRPVFGVGALPDGCRWPDRPHWIRSDRLKESHYRALHRECEILVYFSEYEGYGMPPIEAIGRGLHALSSDLPPMRESLPPEVLFNNERYTDFRTKLSKLLSGEAPPRISWPSHADVTEKLVTLMRNV